MTTRTGNVERLRSGRWSARISFGDGTRERLGTFATEDEARGVVAAALRELGLDVEGATRQRLADLARDFLDGRELDGMRSIGDARSIWRTWVEPAKFYSRPIRSLEARDVRRWVREIARQRADQTARNALNLLRGAFRFAVEEKGWIRVNPADGVTVPSTPRTVEPWSYLTQAEAPRLLDLADDDERAVIAFALGTGLRAGEQAALQLRDLHLDAADPFVTVRFGGIGQPTKTGQIRRVPLFGVALDAARAWVERLPRWCIDRHGRNVNERGLVFPTRRGNPRAVGRMLGREFRGFEVGADGKRREKYVDRWRSLCERAGLFAEDADRPLVWHSLRHTCASWLVSGWFGRAWSLEEVRALLGHASVTTTERYAHLGEGLLTRAARGTGAGSTLAAIRPAQGDPTRAGLDDETTCFQAPPTGIEPVTFGLGSSAATLSIRELAADVGQVAGRYLRALAEGDDAGAVVALEALAWSEIARACPDALEALRGGPGAHRAATSLAAAVLGRMADQRKAAG